MFIGLLMAGCLLVSLEAAALLESPCPDLFRYESTDQKGQWTATLKVLTDVDLRGTWIRLKFDGKLIELTVDDSQATVIDRGDNLYLIKNPEAVLKELVPKEYKITAKYEGDEIPKLEEYLLNARLICPPKNLAPKEFFTSDISNEDFLKPLLAKHPVPTSDFVGCGTVPVSSKNGQYPWQASIHVHKPGKEDYVCQATLISARHLLTAAHCVTYQFTALPVEAGQLAAYFTTGDNNIEQVEIGKITPYPGYSSSNVLLNDLAVVELVKPVTVNDYVRPICLSKREQLPEIDEGVLVGREVGTNRKYGELGQVDMKVGGEEKCILGTGLIIDNTICATYVKENKVCVGDSGSSLASLRHDSKTVWELKGVLIAGAALQDKYVCDESTSVVLVDTANYYFWIQSIIS